MEHGGACAPRPSWGPCVLVMRPVGVGALVCPRVLCYPRITSLPFKQGLIPFQWCDVCVLDKRVLSLMRRRFALDPSSSQPGCIHIGSSRGSSATLWLCVWTFCGTVGSVPSLLLPCYPLSILLASLEGILVPHSSSSASKLHAWPRTMQHIRLLWMIRPPQFVSSISK